MIGKNLHHLDWDISFLKNNPVVRSKEFGITKEAKSTRYPIRLLRYWFGYHLLRDEFERVGRPLDVAEIGVGTGQMLRFTKSVLQMASPAHTPFAWRRWTAVDAILEEEKLRKAGYEEFSLINLESPDYRLPCEYDAAVLLHVLEHLFEPEEALCKVAEGLRPGGVLIGGFPVLPNCLIANRQSRVRRTARPMGHVSVFSPERVIRMGAQAGMETEFLTGAFFFRSKGSPLENSPAWMRFNLAWGARFPSWPGEIYWRMRKKIALPSVRSGERSEKS